MNGLYSVANERDEIVVRFKKSMFDSDEIARFLEYLELESIRRRSQLTQAQANTLADEIDLAGWNNLKSTSVRV
jgi:hypothetical protein